MVLEWDKEEIRVEWERNITRWQEHVYPSTAALSFSKEGLAVYLENSHLTITWICILTLFSYPVSKVKLSQVNKGTHTAAKLRAGLAWVPAPRWPPVQHA